MSTWLTTQDGLRKNYEMKERKDHSKDHKQKSAPRNNKEREIVSCIKYIIKLRIIVLTE